MLSFTLLEIKAIDNMKSKLTDPNTKKMAKVAGAGIVGGALLRGGKTIKHVHNHTTFVRPTRVIRTSIGAGQDDLDDW